MHPKIFDNACYPTARFSSGPDILNASTEAGPETSLDRLRREISDPAAACRQLFDPEELPPASAAGKCIFVNDQHVFRGPFPHAPPALSNASRNAELDTTLRMIAPDLLAWMGGIRKRIAPEMTKSIYLIGYAKDNPTLGFAIGEMAAEFLIEKGVDPRLISVSRDDQARTGHDVWLRIIAVPTRAATEAIRREYA